MNRRAIWSAGFEGNGIIFLNANHGTGVLLVDEEHCQGPPVAVATWRRH
jgi:hypothetical protein